MISGDAPPRTTDGGVPGSAERSSPLAVEVELVELDAPPVRIDEGRIRALVRFVLAREGQSGDWTVTVVLTDDRRLRSLHRDFMGIDEETDVMTFPFGPEERPAGGEIVVSVERAADQGPAHGHDSAREVAFLVVHGVLHLCGWDDGTAEGRERMLARQNELLGAFDAATI